MKTFEGDGESGLGLAATGDVEAPPGYESLVGSAAIAPAPAASGLALEGEDRARFLHGQTTCDVQALTEGGGVYGFFVSPKGRVLADAVVSAHADRLQVELPAGKAAEVSERLRRYVVADRVEVAVREPAGDLLIAGPRAAAMLAPLLGGRGAPAGWDHVVVSWEHGLTVRGELRAGVPAWRLSGPAASLEAAESVLLDAGAAPAAVGALEAVRVERGLPRAGVDFDERHFPQETGLEDWAVSYTKGCYIGQEVVARIHYRGRANHRLRGLRAAAGARPPQAGPLSDEAGEDAGGLTSPVFSPALGRGLGLAVLHRRWAEPGTRLRAADGTGMEVTALPFVEPTSGPRPAR